MGSSCSRFSGIGVIFVQPLYEQNIGYIARCMKNFCLAELVLVKPRCSLGSESRKYAMHGAEILERVKIVDSFEEAIKGFDLVVCTTGVKGGGVLRRYVVPRDAASIIAENTGRRAIVIGREDWGLTNEELSLCDLVVTIEANPDYPSLNASHAAVIVFYEIFNAVTQVESPRIERPSRNEVDKLLEYLDLLGRELGYDEARLRKSKLIMRRIVTEARFSALDLRMLMGYFGDSLKRIRECRRSLTELGRAV
ncbi:RNA methyltransferase [Infirmifilum lucidum]|uniref:RNA methyltransferase n=1 Tax=Infirmifilum lucidum TaxID=2776706 RepID=A0A7L9FHD5_9CREN|nr:RNA methyltransferase [Infirmifilum lucidum]QOJ78185.1 RNA methyltransferase [Infirmifilum lucidum]